jgi:DNA polymerase III sliding clamp (beta) subunit (PCNA family)
MQFVVKRDILLKSLNFVQGVVEKKKYITNTFKCFITTKG